MKSLFIKLDSYRALLSLPFILLCIILIVFNTLALFGVDNFVVVNSYYQANISIVALVLFCSFIVYSACSKFDKAVCATTVLLVADLVYFAVCEYHFSLVLIILLSCFFAFIYSKLELKYALILSSVFGVVIAFIMSFADIIVIEITKNIAMTLSDKPSAYAVINNVYNLLFSTRLEEYIFDSGIGASVVINDSVITGVKGVFEATIENPHQLTSAFLSGKYFVNIFVALGLFLFLYSKFDGIQKISLVMIILCSAIFGNNLLLSLYLLLLNPVSYFGYLFMIFVCNIVASLLDLRIGYIQQGSLFELIKYADNMLYFAVSALIIAVLAYFVFRMIFVYFDASNNVFLSKDAKRIISSLGGKKNIKNIENNCVYVDNANLINILKLDCEIYGNKVVLLDDDVQTLRENL